MQIKLNIKPLSVNEAWKGKRFKTDKYKDYESLVLSMLPNTQIDSFKRLKITYGMSNINSDVDNPTKPILDILQKKYGFNDSQIIELHLIKVKTKKGEEFINIDVME